jgi:hypothetical protein
MATPITWRSVSGFEGVYEVSSGGDVRSLARLRKGHGTYAINDRVMHGFHTPGGYRLVRLYIPGEHGKWLDRAVHRLVASAFLESGNGRRCVNHKNGIKTDNRVDNLEWVTPSENMQHAFRTGLKVAVYGESHGMAKLTASSVLEIRRQLALGHTQEHIARAFGISRGTVRDINIGKTWTYLHSKSS